MRSQRQAPANMPRPAKYQSSFGFRPEKRFDPDRRPQPARTSLNTLRSGRAWTSGGGHFGREDPEAVRRAGEILHQRGSRPCPRRHSDLVRERPGKNRLTLFEIWLGLASLPLTNWKTIPSHFHDDFDERDWAIASLHRQTATFRPLQRWSLLDQAEEWERLAVTELEAYFNASLRHDDRQPQTGRYAETRRETAVAREPDTWCIRGPTGWERASAMAA
jgi:hypothetical protein